MQSWGLGGVVLVGCVVGWEEEEEEEEGWLSSSSTSSVAAESMWRIHCWICLDARVVMAGFASPAASVGFASGGFFSGSAASWLVGSGGGGVCSRECGVSLVGFDVLREGSLDSSFGAVCG